MPDTEQDPEIKLARETVNGQARQVAIEAASAVGREPAGRISYTSGGTVLVIGTEIAAMNAALQLNGHAGIRCTMLVTGADPQGVANKPASEDQAVGTPTIRVAISTLTGYLGNFQVSSEDSHAVALLHAAADGRQAFDIVLDLSIPPYIQSALPPPGYFAPGGDTDALARALDEIPALVGQFEKPQYFHYNAAICAHGRSGITACTRCLDVCPADAIISIGDTIEVDPQLCQGAGGCATACPTGAITYGYPRLSDTLQRLRTLLGRYHEAGGTGAVLLIDDAEAGRAMVGRVAGQIPENVLPLEIEELGSVGLDTWLAALAYGTARLVLLATPSLPDGVCAEIEAQLSFARAILEGMGYGSGLLELTACPEPDLIGSLGAALPPPITQRATFAALDEKRSIIRLAVDHLFENAPAPRSMITLPAGAPFGEVLVDGKRCTLCMACASQCPAHALSAGDGTPQLGFIEANCVQCGLCCRTCPEDAIAISPRYLFDTLKRGARRVLHEEEPFNCIVCGKPFATRSVIDRISNQMASHPMFQGEALARIRMCEDCRVKSIFEQEGAQAASKIRGNSS